DGQSPEHDLDVPAFRQKLDTVVGAVGKTWGGVGHLYFLSNHSPSASRRGRRGPVSLERGFATCAQFGVGDRPAFLLHAFGAEGGVAAQHLLVLLALTDICRRARVGRCLLRRDTAGKSKHQRGSEAPRDLPGHHPLLLYPVAIRMMPPDRDLLNPPWSIRR